MSNSKNAEKRRSLDTVYMYRAKDFANMSEKEIRNFMINEHAYLEEDVAEYDRQFMIEILTEIPEID